MREFKWSPDLIDRVADAARDHDEVRVTSPTGGEKGAKLGRFDLIPPEFEEALAWHLGVGAQKYADRNWQRGYAWSLSYAALRRHLAAFWGGEDNDPETDEPHIIAAAWHCMALHYFSIYFPQFDDRHFPVAPDTWKDL